MSPETLQNLEQVKFEITTLKNDITFIEYQLERGDLKEAFLNLSAIKFERLSNLKLFKVIEAIEKENAIELENEKERLGLNK